MGYWILKSKFYGTDINELKMNQMNGFYIQKPNWKVIDNLQAHGKEWIINKICFIISLKQYLNLRSIENGSWNNGLWDDFY